MGNRLGRRAIQLLQVRFAAASWESAVRVYYNALTALCLAAFD